MTARPVPNRPAGAPAVVISLDFELRWGVADKLGDHADAYGANLRDEPDAALGMIELFEREGVGATWATVGALACSDWDEYHARAPRPPAYEDKSLRFRKAWQDIDPRGTLHFAPDAVAAIARAPRQELASHTFSHLYFRENGCRPEDMLADAEAVADIFRDRFGRTPTSFVYPRNQLSHPEVLQRAGIRRWRTNPRVFYWNATRGDEQSRLARALRLADAVLPLGTRRAPSSEMRASYLVRFPLPDRAWKLHARRISNDARGLKAGETLHLWWHPHNLGGALTANLRRLSELIEQVREAAPPGTRFVTMEESGADADEQSAEVHTRAAELQPS